MWTFVEFMNVRYIVKSVYCMQINVLNSQSAGKLIDRFLVYRLNRSVICFCILEKLNLNTRFVRKFYIGQTSFDLIDLQIILLDHLQ